MIRLEHQRGKASCWRKKLSSEVGELVKQGRTEEARVKAIALVGNNDKVELLSTLLVDANCLLTRLDLVLSQETCPVEAQEACCDIVFAVPGLERQPELKELRKCIVSRFGRHFGEDCLLCDVFKPEFKRRVDQRQPDEEEVTLTLVEACKECGVEPPPSLARATMQHDHIRPCATTATIGISPTVKRVPPTVLHNATLPVAPKAGEKCRIEWSDDAAHATIEGYVSGPQGIRIIADVAKGNGTHAIISFVPPVVYFFFFFFFFQVTPFVSISLTITNTKLIGDSMR